MENRLKKGNQSSLEGVSEARIRTSLDDYRHVRFWKPNKLNPSRHKQKAM